MDKLSQECEIIVIQPALQSQAFIFRNNCDNNCASVQRALSTQACCDLAGKDHGFVINFLKNLTC